MKPPVSLATDIVQTTLAKIPYMHPIMKFHHRIYNDSHNYILKLYVMIALFF